MTWLLQQGAGSMGREDVIEINSQVSNSFDQGKKNGIKNINMEIGLGEMLHFLLDIWLIVGQPSGNIFEIVGNL